MRVEGDGDVVGEVVYEIFYVWQFEIYCAYVFYYVLDCLFLDVAFLDRLAYVCYVLG